MVHKIHCSVRYDSGVTVRYVVEKSGEDFSMNRKFRRKASSVLILI